MWRRKNLKITSPSRRRNLKITFSYGRRNLKITSSIRRRYLRTTSSSRIRCNMRVWRGIKTPCTVTRFGCLFTPSIRIRWWWATSRGGQPLPIIKPKWCSSTLSTMCSRVWCFKPRWCRWFEYRWRNRFSVSTNSPWLTMQSISTCSVTSRRSRITWKWLWRRYTVSSMDWYCRNATLSSSCLRIIPCAHLSCRSIQFPIDSRC